MQDQPSIRCASPSSAKTSLRCSLRASLRTALLSSRGISGRISVDRLFGRRTAIGAALVFSALVPWATGAAQSARIMDTRPTVAVFYFENAALVDHERYDPLRKGLALMIGYELARNTRIRVVERDQLQSLLNEQNFQSTDRVDPATAVRLGKLLGARYFVDGAFVMDASKKVRIDVRAINTETGQWEYVETIGGKVDQLLDLVTALGAKLNKGMKLPDIPVVKGAESASRGPNQERIAQLLSRAEEEMDRGNAKYAASLYRNVLALNANYDLAKSRLATIEGAAKP
jgi:TolB-like protein